MESKADVVIIGGGMVGAAFALALSRGQPNIKIMVIESQIPDSNGVENLSFDARSTALAYSSMQLLQQLELAENLSDIACGIDSIHVSERSQPGRVLMTAEQEQVPALGYVIENKRLGQLLWQSLATRRNIEVLAPATITSLRCVTGGIEIQGNSKQGELLMHPALTVLADGGRSGLAAQLGIEHEVHDYASAAIISNIKFSQQHKRLAFERFTESGPVAVLPLSGGQWGEYRSALIWSLATADASELMAVPKHEFAEKLQQQFGYRLGAIEHIGERLSYPLSLRLAQEQIRPGLALLGNVAHNLHPVAGQGFNLALRDSFVLAACLKRGLQQGKTLDDFVLLQQYLAKQQSDHERTTGFSHILPQLFAEQSALAGVRQLGLAGMQLSATGKHLMASLGMGTLGSASRWSQQ